MSEMYTKMRAVKQGKDSLILDCKEEDSDMGSDRILEVDEDD
jgi:hypothetical protein